MIVGALHDVVDAGPIGAQHDTALFAPRWSTLSGDVVRPVLGVGVGELLQAAFLVVTALVLEFLITGTTLGVLLVATVVWSNSRGRP